MQGDPGEVTMLLKQWRTGNRAAERYRSVWWRQAACHLFVDPCREQGWCGDCALFVAGPETERRRRNQTRMFSWIGTLYACRSLLINSMRPSDARTTGEPNSLIRYPATASAKSAKSAVSSGEAEPKRTSHTCAVVSCVVKSPDAVTTRRPSTLNAAE